MAEAMFGAGCFWGVESAFRGLKGVLSTSVGYSGGTTENPSYEQVCSDQTGHAEVVHINYTPDLISYETLLKVFWQIHNPTTLNRQGFDIGTQYRSVIFFYSEEQKLAAESSLKELENSKKYSQPIVTAIEPAKVFYPAEEYHQHYYEKRQIKPKCVVL